VLRGQCVLQQASGGACVLRRAARLSTVASSSRHPPSLPPRRIATTGEAHFAECPQTLSETTKALGKLFAERYTRQRGNGKKRSPRVFYRALGKDFAERPIQHSAKKIDVTTEETVTNIYRAPGKALGKVYAICRVLV
jgi:hypothetical protein